MCSKVSGAGVNRNLTSHSCGAPLCINYIIYSLVCASSPAGRTAGDGLGCLGKWHRNFPCSWLDQRVASRTLPLSDLINLRSARGHLSCDQRPGREDTPVCFLACNYNVKRLLTGSCCDLNADRRIAIPIVNEAN